MRVIGLAGGIGSGKSAAAEILAGFGARVIDADKVGHSVYAPGTVGMDRVVAEFGEEVVGPDGSIDRKALGARVFGAPERLQALNRIVHPLIRAEIQRQIDQARQGGEHPATIVEAAILLEAGWDDLVDEIWVLVAPEEAVISRLVEKRGFDPEDVRARMKRQMSVEERRKRADHVIENLGDLADLESSLREAWAARVVD